LEMLILKALGKLPEQRQQSAAELLEGLVLISAQEGVPLTDLPRDQTTFTYPDSFTAMGFLPRFGLPYEPRPYHGQVFWLEQLDAVVGRYGLPADDPTDGYAGYERRPFERYVEVQLWADEPIRQLRHP